MMERPNVYEYLDFHEFLMDFIDYMKSADLFSNRTFAKRAGFSSHSFLAMVLAGKRSLPKKSAEKIAKGMELKVAEAKYFCLLAQFNQTEDLEEKSDLYSKITKTRNAREISVLEKEEFEFYSDWVNIAIYESCSSEFRDFNVDKVSEALGVTPAKVEKALDLLLTLDLVEKNRRQIKKKKLALKTAPGARSFLIRSFHRAMVEKALHTIESSQTDKRDVSSLTISLSESGYYTLKDKVTKFRAEINELFSKEKGPDRVYQVNFQIFPLMDIPKN